MWFFRPPPPPINLGAELTVELHNHVLPGLDDGAKTVEEAIQMIFFWAEMGYQKVITTPHIGATFRPSSHQIEETHSRLCQHLQEQEIPIFLTAAAEYLLEAELKADLTALRAFGPKRHLLIEFGFWILPPRWQELTFALQSAGYTIVIAHPERYEFATRELLRSWYEQGFYLQLNLLSLVGYYGKAALQRAEYLLEKGWVHFVGSDMHSPSQIAPLRKALQHKTLRRRFSTFLNPSLL
ncbi:MAG: CpsB/CapC family capsule biosynthesis tyrosine phosphatase [Bacteroidia bacterium]